MYICKCFEIDTFKIWVSGLNFIRSWMVKFRSLNSCRSTCPISVPKGERGRATARGLVVMGTGTGQNGTTFPP